MRVVPVTVRGAKLPTADELPESLRAIVYRSGVSVRRNPDFAEDIARLIDKLWTMLGRAKHQHVWFNRRLAFVAGVFVALAICLLFSDALYPPFNRAKMFVTWELARLQNKPVEFNREVLRRWKENLLARGTRRRHSDQRWP